MCCWLSTRPPASTVPTLASPPRRPARVGTRTSTASGTARKCFWIHCGAAIARTRGPRTQT
eukprot:9445297-Alexandrium_andersonii.AAC.1